MRVRALKSFGGNGIHIPEGLEFDLPSDADWLRAGLVEEAGNTQLGSLADQTPTIEVRTETAMLAKAQGRKAPPGLPEVKGVSDARVEQLAAIGIRTIPDLLAADARKVADALPGVGLKTVENWQEFAREIMAEL